jgi:hypothetical protein
MSSPANQKQWKGGITGARFDELDDLNPGRIDDEWPVDSDGCKLQLGNVISDTMDRAPEGIVRLMGNAEPIDPPVSEAQRRAMYAAASGHSNLGIPKSVGKEFVEAGHGVKNLPEHVGHKK